MKNTAGLDFRSGSWGEDGGSAAFQIIILGAGGGPNEDNVSGILVRSVAAQWSKNSILAVDAGVHLAALTRIFEKHMPGAIQYNAQERGPISAFSQIVPRVSNSTAPNHRQPLTRGNSFVTRTLDWSTPGSPAPSLAPGTKLVMTTGPFKDILLPAESAKANAALLLRNLISTYLITHPHLDHLAGFAINTAAFHNTSRPKKLAALPWCIESIKTHIFNDVIWPNLSDEEGGVGFVSYTRLMEGGNVALGEGEGKGYIEVCEGLEVKCLAVSHGQCMKKRPQYGSGQDGLSYPQERTPSRPSLPPSPDLRRNSFPHIDFPTRVSQPACVVDSTAFFIRCPESGQEVLIFGDVEPDSISLSPRNFKIWESAAPKIAAGLLKAIFIECSYDDSRSDETLFGHLAPRHLADEMRALAEKVVEYKTLKKTGLNPADFEAARKRKRKSDTPDQRRGRPMARSSLGRQSASISPSTHHVGNGIETSTEQSRELQKSLPLSRSKGRSPLPDKPLDGLTVVVIHIKENFTDSTPISEIVLDQLNAYETIMGLGVEYMIPVAGGSFYI